MKPDVLNLPEERSGRWPIQIWICMAAICCLQLGGASTLSVSFVFAMILAIRIGLSAYLRVLPWSVLGGIAILAPQFGFLHSENIAGSMLRAFREILVLSMILACHQSALKGSISRQMAERVVLYLSCILFAFAILQMADTMIFHFGLYMPTAFYGPSDLESGTTLSSYWFNRAAEYGYAAEKYIRPSAFYSEPSYLGFICLSIYYFTDKVIVDRRLFIKVFVLVVSTLLVAQTAYGIACLGIYFLASERGRILLHGKRGFLIKIALLAFVFAMAGTRLYVLATNPEQEISGYIRLVQPFVNIYTVVASTQYFGIPSFYFIDFLDASGVSTIFGYGLDNGVLNMFMYYGIGGFLILYVLYVKLGKLSFLYVALCGMQNGALLHFDKAVVIVLVLSLVRKFAKNERVRIRNHHV